MESIIKSISNISYWLLKTEPSTFSWDNQVKANVEPWDGVRNYQARNNLRAMKVGDLAFFYHTAEERKIVGIVEIYKEAYPDTDHNFSCVDVKTKAALSNPVSLSSIKLNPKLQNMILIKNSRLSVLPVSKEDFMEIIKMSKK